MLETARMDIFLTTRHDKAASSFGGSAMNAQRASILRSILRSIAGFSLGLYSKIQQAALVVLGTSFVIVTLWKLCVRMLLLILTLQKMVSLLLW